MMRNTTKSVVITGVSTGIGYATAADLVERGYTVFGSVRRQEDADRIQAELGTGFKPLIFDVTDIQALQRAGAQVRAHVGDRGLQALINNAGIVVPGPLMHMSISDFQRQLEVNVTGMFATTQVFLPLLGARRNSPQPPGRIINISSVSGRVAYPFMGAYAASKHAMEGLSDALRRELMLYGIDIISIQPGTVRTPIMSKFSKQVAEFANTDYGHLLESLDETMAKREKTALPVERVTEVIRKALESERVRTRYPIPRQRFIGRILPYLPDRLFDRLIAYQMGLKP